MKPQNKNIILIGFMGCGKSTVGRRLANIAGRSFFETDLEIEKRLNKKISYIISEYGESYFRDIESEICRIAGKMKNAVISTGGGVVIRTENIRLLKENGVVVYLSAKPEHLYENLKNDSTRPLLANTTGNERLKEIERLLDERSLLYETAADFIIDATDKSIDEIIDKVLIIFNIGGNK